MENKRVSIPILTAVVASALLLHAALLPAAELFHSGGTGKCEGCHAIGGAQQPAIPAAPDTNGTDGGEQIVITVKSASRNAAEQGSGAAGGTPMLRGSDPSSTCLLCHEPLVGDSKPRDYYVSTPQSILQQAVPPVQLTPAGDFGWLKKNYRWTSEGGGIGGSPGERHGHNIVALDYKYSADGTRRTAPGGSYPADSLSCISCHDPHGNYRRKSDGTISTTGPVVIASGSYTNSPEPDANGSVGSYRMLAGKGYQPKSVPSAPPFSDDPPAAMAPPSYNRPEAVTDTRVAYGSGMSEWCQNCHPQMHTDGGSRGSQHPSGNDARFSAKTMGTYSYYLKSGDLNGSAGSSYTSMVPYEMGTSDYEVLRATANSDGSNLSGPGTSGSNPNVMCLSCHRAHASGWDSMLRWNGESTFLVHDGRYPGIDNGAPSVYAQGRTEAEFRKAFYDRPASRYASYQRSLCNKCHGQD